MAFVAKVSEMERVDVNTPGAVKKNEKVNPPSAVDKAIAPTASLSYVGASKSVDKADVKTAAELFTVTVQEMSSKTRTTVVEPLV